jgi:anti-sigma factor (TIGR02949 family)
MTCEEAMRSLAEYLDNELTAGNEQSIREHLELCRSCYSRAEFERRLKSELRKLGKDDVPIGFEQRVRRLLQSFGPSADSQTTKY